MSLSQAWMALAVVVVAVSIGIAVFLVDESLGSAVQATLVVILVAATTVYAAITSRLLREHQASPFRHAEAEALATAMKASQELAWAAGSVAWHVKELGQLPVHLEELDHIDQLLDDADPVADELIGCAALLPKRLSEEGWAAVRCLWDLRSVARYLRGAFTHAIEHDHESHSDVVSHALVGVAGPLTGLWSVDDEVTVEDLLNGDVPDQARETIDQFRVSAHVHLREAMGVTLEPDDVPRSPWFPDPDEFERSGRRLDHRR